MGCAIDNMSTVCAWAIGLGSVRSVLQSTMGRIGSGEAPNGDGVLWENDVAIVGFHRTNELRRVSSMY